jgi:drug/metabolite transporter (DMT)-like permease
MSSTMKKLTIIAAFAAIYLFWGSTYLAIRIGLESLPPFLLAGARFVIAGGALYAWLRLKGLPRPTDTQWWWSVVTGLLMLVGGAGGVTWAEQWVPSGPACLLIATVPMWMTLIDTLVLRHRLPGWQVAIGLVLGLLGLVVLIGPTSNELGGIDRLGAIVIVLAALSWSIGSLTSRAASLPESPFMTVAMQMFTAGVVLLVISGLNGEWQGVNVSAITTRSLVALVYLVAIGSIVSLTSYVWLLRQVSASAVATYALVNPVVAVYLGWALAGESVGSRVISATLLIVVAVLLIQSASWRRDTDTKAPARQLRLTGSPAPCTAVAMASAPAVEVDACSHRKLMGSSQPD